MIPVYSCLSPALADIIIPESVAFSPSPFCSLPSFLSFHYPLFSIAKIQWLRRAGYPQEIIQEIITEQDHYEKQLAEDNEEDHVEENNGYFAEETGEWVEAAPGETYDEWGTLIVKDGVEQGFYDEESGEWIQTAEYDEWGTLISGGVEEQPQLLPEPLPELPTADAPQQDGVPVQIVPEEPVAADLAEEEEEAVPDIVMAEPQPAGIAPQPSPGDAKKTQQQEAIDKELKAAQDAAKAAGDVAKNLIGGIGGSLFGGGGAKKGGGLGGMFGAVAAPKKPTATSQAKSPPKPVPTTAEGAARLDPSQQPQVSSSTPEHPADGADKPGTGPAIAGGGEIVEGDKRKGGANLAGAVQVLPAVPAAQKTSGEPAAGTKKEGDVDAEEGKKKGEGQKFLPDDGKPRFVKHFNKTRTMSGRQKWDWAFEKILQVGTELRFQNKGGAAHRILISFFTITCSFVFSIFPFRLVSRCVGADAMWNVTFIVTTLIWLC